MAAIAIHPDLCGHRFSTHPCEQNTHTLTEEAVFSPKHVKICPSSTQPAALNNSTPLLLIITFITCVWPQGGARALRIK